MKNSGDIASTSPSRRLGRPNDWSLAGYFAAHDFSPHTRRAVASDLRKFAAWFNHANREELDPRRITTRDVADYRDFLRRERRQAVNTVNRSLVSIRRYLAWLTSEGVLKSNVAHAVKELRKVRLAPRGLERADLRLLLREVELRQDMRASAIVNLLLFTGARVSDAVNLELADLKLGARSGIATFRSGKGRKERSVPVPLTARKALEAYLAVRPSSETSRMFLGERGPLTDRGVRALFRKYSAIIGVRVHPHALRHTMAGQFLAANGNDLVGLAQILGHESITTTGRYAQRSEGQLTDAVEAMAF